MDNKAEHQLNHSTYKESEPSPKKPIGGDRLKRDEWSEGAVSSLLEAYETKWALRNRAKLKGHDWEDVARHVSSRANSTKSPKTQTQCKNKIESMKKRYRSESATADGSSWPLYPRLDLLLRGTAPPPPLPLPPPPEAHHSMMLVDPSGPPFVALQQLPPPPPAAPPPAPVGIAQNSLGSNRMVKEDGVGTKLSDPQLSDKNIPVETDSSTPAVYIPEKENMRSEKMKMSMENQKSKKKRRREQWEIAESIRWLAEVMLRSEQARMDTMRELERMRVEADSKRGEMDLKRTEIIANTQLEIARIIAGVGKNVDSSLRIGRN